MKPEDIKINQLLEIEMEGEKSPLGQPSRRDKRRLLFHLDANEKGSTRCLHCDEKLAWSFVINTAV